MRKGALYTMSKESTEYREYNTIRQGLLAYDICRFESDYSFFGAGLVWVNDWPNAVSGRF